MPEAFSRTMNIKHIHFCILVYFIIVTSCVKQKNEWYVIKKIDDRTYILSEPKSSQGNSVFLITGSKEAILFDAGSGENRSESTLQAARSLTNLPITLLLSHFHFDHIGNISDFNSMGIQEIESLQDRISADSLIYFTKEETLTKNTGPLKISRLFTVEKDIDLGNRKIRILPTPGHTKESISIMDHENGYIFTGDLLYNGLLLIDDCQTYIKSIGEIIEKSDSSYRVFGSHGKPEVNYEQLYQLKRAIEIFHSDSCSIPPLRQINFYGSTKDIYKIGDISFIYKYTN
jgi:glyoxylase-like metal-dependent hydrolase (beta-lactamase superfamily II)